MLSQSGSFNIGEKVVYPNHGIGIIEQIGSRTIGQNVEKFYLLNIKSSSLKVMVPFHNVQAVGMRRVVRRAEIEQLLDFLQKGQCENNTAWKDRFRENSERMRTGSLIDVASVMKSLLTLAEEKPLSFRERKMLGRCRYLIVSELAMAKGCEESEIESLLAQALGQSNLRLPDAAEFEN